MKYNQNKQLLTEKEILLEYHGKSTPGILVVEVPISILGESENESPPEWRRLDGIRVKGDKYIVINYSNDDKIKEIIKGKRVQIIEVKKVLNRSVIGQVYIGRDFFKDRYDHWDIEMVILTRDKKYNASLYRWCVWNNIKVNPDNAG